MDFYRECNNQSIIDLIVCLRMDAPLWVFAYIIFVISLIHDLSFKLMYRGYHRHLSSRADIPSFTVDLDKVCKNQSIIDLIVCLKIDAPLWVFAYIIFVMSLIHDLSFMLKYRGYHSHLSSRTDIPSLLWIFIESVIINQ